MYLRLIVIFLLLTTYPVFSQVTPVEGSHLNHTLIAFATGDEKRCNCALEIAEGNFGMEKEFSHAILKLVPLGTNRVIYDLPSFGKSYTWRIIDRDRKQGNKTELHHFTVDTTKEADTNASRLRITRIATANHEDGYVTLDGCACMYDMTGKLVWFLPRNDLVGNIRDLKVSPAGTITFLDGDEAYEESFDGKILWKAPIDTVNGKSVTTCHHQFNRLANGHYMVLGIDFGYVLKKWTESTDADFIKEGTDANAAADTSYRKVAFGNIREFDKNGKLIWTWRSMDYIRTSDLRYWETPRHMIYMDMRENAFYFDEKKKEIYVSFKTVSRILKIEYPSGKVISSYGETFRPGYPALNNGLFYGQHACNVSSEGNLYLFNNNMRDLSDNSEVLVFNEPGSETDTLSVKWKYTCNLDGLDKEMVLEMKSRDRSFMQSGGNVEELADHSFFVSMGVPASKLQIVDPDKKAEWEAAPEHWDAVEGKWLITSQYRAHITEDKDVLKKMVTGLGQ